MSRWRSMAALASGTPTRNPKPVQMYLLRQLSPSIRTCLII